MSEWKECKLVDIADVQTGPFGSQLKNEQYITGGTPVVTVEHINNFRIIDFDYPSVTSEDKKRLSKYLLKSGDIVFTRVGSVDLSAFVKPHQDGWMFSSRMLRVRPSHSIDSRYLSYFFQQASFREHILNISVGATMPSINTEILKGISIVYPPLEEQKAIAGVLSSLDDKIDLLHRQNKTLEAMAETLFRQYFIEEAEDSWEESIDNLPIEIIDGDRGVNYPKSSEFSYSGYCLFLSAQNVTNTGFDFNNCSFITKEKDEILRGGKLTRNDIVLTTRGTVGNIAFYNDLISYDNVRINSGMVIFRTKSQTFPALYLYVLMKTRFFSQVIEEHISGSAQPQLPIRDIKSMKILNPPKPILNEFIEKIAPLYNRFFINHAQIRTLEKLRDTLLPKLMSGEVRVSDTLLKREI